MANNPAHDLEKHPSSRHVAWHTLSIDEVARKLRTDLLHGLSGGEAAQRLREHGPNKLREVPGRGPLRMFFGQFSDFMILVLVVAAVISGFIGDVQDTVTIMVIVALNAVVGFIQEYRAERAMAALQQMAAASARVMRDGQVTLLDTAELVPGDVVLLETGNIVPADMRIIEAAPLRMDEAALTGESVAVDKQVAPVEETGVPLGDRRSLAFKGTIVAFGRGRGLVVATGMDSELGKIAALLTQDGASRTPLQKRLAQFGQRLAQFGQRLALAALAICLIVFVVGVMRGESAILMFLTAVSLAVAAIPEALPAVVTISLALGAHKMVRQHALVRRLPAVETLGSVTYICSDKTGTLTQNKMHVAAIFANLQRVRAWPATQEAPWTTLFQALALCNDAEKSRHGKLTGDPTETALLAAAQSAGWDKTALEKITPRIKELPFDSIRKRMTTFHPQDGEVIAFTKGSPEAVIAHCTHMLTAQGMQTADKALLLKNADAMAADGLRVLAVACRHWPELPASPHAGELETELVFLGFAGLIDPPRAEAREAVALCRSAGITAVMITGDHPATARAIAQELGFFAKDGLVMTGPELARLTPQAFEAKVAQVRVYARVDPEQKIKIVKALQDKGEVVAMTGDGVNDAPALKAADIGVAMGRGGTDVAREAAHMVLLDDNFATIVAAVRQGRRLFDNIRKFIRYAVTTNSAEIWTIFLAPFLGLPIPLLPIHILWINLVTDGLPALALSAEPAEKGIMRRPPRPPGESIFAHGMWQHMVWVGLLMAGITLSTQAWTYHTGSAHWQTMVFTVLTLAQLAHVLAIRSERESLLRIGLLSNKPMLAAVLLTFALQMSTLYVPALNPLFKTEALTGGELAACIGIASVVFFAVEIEKWLMRHGRLYQDQSKGWVSHG